MNEDKHHIHDLQVLSTWKVDSLKDFCKRYGLSVSKKTKDQLIALAYSAQVMKVEPSTDKQNSLLQLKKEYTDILNLSNGDTIVNPLGLPDDVWMAESAAVPLWPYIQEAEIMEFLSTTSTKAYEYMESEWIKQVYFFRWGKYCLFKSKCTPSQRLNDIPHCMWICVKHATGSIMQAYCSCTAGLSGTCNHITAMLFRIEQKNSLPCTSLPCMWDVPADKTKVSPIMINDMNFKKSILGKTNTRVLADKKKKEFNPSACQATTTQEWVTLLQKVVPESCFVSAFSKPKSTMPEDTLQLVDMHKCVNYNLLPLPILSCSTVNAIEVATRGQSSNPLWKKARTGRITASTFHEVSTKIMKMNASQAANFDPLLCKIMNTSKPLNHIPAVQHGCDMEPTAKCVYTKMLQSQGHINVVVKNCGIFLDCKNIYIGASPDAAVSCTCCGSGLVEIKCPYSCKDSSLQEKLPPYLQRINYSFSLKRSHPYYTQIQGQLAVTKRNWCDLFVYCEHDYIVERIYFDEMFKEQSKAKAGLFFHKLPLSITSTN